MADHLVSAVQQSAAHWQAGAHVSLCAVCVTNEHAERRTGRVWSAALLTRSLPRLELSILQSGKLSTRVRALPGRVMREPPVT